MSDPSDHDAPIRVITMERSARSRWGVFRRLTREDIQAALAFAAESVRMERLGAVQHGS